jgi:biotin-(acetyl-CoA carboxylase) ligase
LLIAKELHELILFRLNDFSQDRLHDVLARYNENLYKRDQLVRLKKDGVLFESRIKGVNESGELLTKDRMDRKFRNGEVEFVF